MEIAFVCFPYSIAEIVEIAQTADTVSQPLLLGIADSPRLFAESYVATHAVLAATERVIAGPFCTNPVTRHWSVHAGLHRSLEERFPGRGFMGLAAGDSAVHAFGLRPATAAVLEEHGRRVREFGPENLRVIMPVGGLKTAARAALATDEIVIGQGIDPGATEQLSAAALRAREEAGINRPLKRWLYVLADVWESADAEEADPGEREIFRSMIMAYSRQAMDFTFEGKNVPQELQAGLKQLYSEFSFERYGTAYNAQLLERFAAEKDFVTARFAMSGTPEQIASQLRSAVERTGVDSVWVGLLSKQAQPMMKLFIERVLPRLKTVEAA